MARLLIKRNVRERLNLRFFTDSVTKPLPSRSRKRFELGHIKDAGRVTGFILDTSRKRLYININPSQNCRSRSHILHDTLILSIFPGIDLLGHAFEEVGFCVVRGPDLITGGDIRRFKPDTEKIRRCNWLSTVPGLLDPQ